MPGGSEPTVSRRRVLGILGGAAATGLLASCSSSSSPAPAGDGTTSRPVPAPAGFVRTRWAADPWALGAYSYLPVGATPARREALGAPVDGWLHLAGEAVSTAAPATVHGARASGRAAAEAVREAIDDNGTVVVVGAGAAGAAAARVLADAGIEVVVVEARDRTGGRIGTTAPEGWPIPVEMGASFVHDVAASDSADRLADLDVGAEPFTYATAYRDADGGRIDDGDAAYATGYAAIEEAVAWAEEADADVSLAVALDRSGAAARADEAALALAARSEVEVELGVDPGHLSAWWGLDEGSTGDDLIVLGGYGALVDADLDGVDVRLDWPVTAIDLTGDRIVLATDDGRTLAADQVVVTVPLAVLAADVVTFTPTLPAAHREAIAALGTGLLDKVWLRWDEAWWGEEAEVWSSVDGPFEWCNLLPATGEPVLLAFLGGATARRWSSRPDDDLRAAALADLARFHAAGW
ncbi:MAG TPA: FAD-dependent oxidoreductase [Iamia sp.]|nr:FAD-dependent oxidoreductase [Iamia sp.]